MLPGYVIRMLQTHIYYKIFLVVLGSIDGKHCVLEAPGNSGSAFRNYKNSFSFVLMGIVDAKYKFIYVDIGAPGSCHDATVLKVIVFMNISISKKLS